MIPSTLFILAATLSSLAAVNGAVIQRDGTFTYLTPQPTAPGQGASTTTTTTGTSPTTTATTTQSSSVTSTRSTTPSSTSTIPSVTTTQTSSSTASVTLTQQRGTTSTQSVTPTGTGTPATTSTQPVVPPKGTTTITSTATPTSPASGAGNCNGVQQWLASFAYTAGDRVIFNGQLFTARQWTYNNAPPAHPDQWVAGGTCAQPINNQANCNGVAAWQRTVAYTAGNRVTFNNHLWSAVQWTDSNTPGDTSGTWKDLGACA